MARAADQVSRGLGDGFRRSAPSRAAGGCMGRAPALSLSRLGLWLLYRGRGHWLFSTLIYGNEGLVTTTKNPAISFFEPVKRA